VGTLLRSTGVFSPVGAAKAACAESSEQVHAAAAAVREHLKGS
jgi:hypothetical protein